MYYYESLGDERFQEFCQALLTASFPNAQCLPVGQPDGGRDAFVIRSLTRAHLGAAETKDIIVFQVKYVRSVETSRDARDMVADVVRKERAKVARLKARGLSRYYLLTNVQGTAHLEVGSIDKVNKELTEAFGIESYCWWRDDLDRRLDNNSSVKWSYPEVLKATDLLEKLVAGHLGEDEERRRSAINAYMTAQYDDDEELKFKQTDLRSNMTDLFVDLPMRQAWHLDEHQRYARAAGVRVELIDERNYLSGVDGPSAMAADFFLRGQNLQEESRVVLEGAPGQGKSTVTQFACQVLRMQLLNKARALDAIPERFRKVRARIPFRVDLRDLAKWMSGIDPFQAKPSPLDEGAPRSLEGFIAGQVRALSGGHTFTVSDFTAVAKASHLFLALDGFDEVAEINLRQKLVEEISKGVNRLLAAGGYSVQTVVTSRPAAFAKSVRFPPQQWSYYELLPLERPQIDEYSDRWSKAKGLKEVDQGKLQATLDAKLRDAHTQYLAKNPMQLTILLSLINSRGASLPEKRTAMYDAYMDMFFGRESEKSDVVRDHLELLVDIHRFLAWKLQTSAEGGGNGSIEQDDLRTLLFSYLDSEGEDTTIVDALFNGIIERVGALVSRVQDTYEFEVQPLREYFAARHLYETSPYPVDDQPSDGDKFGRFKALAKNPYWLNVARFYGGCFNKGEILTLVHELTVLAEDPTYKHTSLPRTVALTLLSDWVFTQYQPAVKQVISFVSEHPQIRQLLGVFESRASTSWGNLPERSGRKDFVENLWQRIKISRLLDEQAALANAIYQNSSHEERLDRWKTEEPNFPHEDWARLGWNLKLFQVATTSQLDSLQQPLSDDILFYLLFAGRFDYIDGSNAGDRARSLLLVNGIYRSSRSGTRKASGLEWLATACSTPQYLWAFEVNGYTLGQVIERRSNTKIAIGEEASLSGLTPREKEAIETYVAFVGTQTSVLSSSLAPWQELVAALRNAWGDCSAFDRIACVAAGIKSKTDTGVQARLSEAEDLVAATRYARLRSGAPKWWSKQISSETTSVELRRLLLLLLAWGTPKTICQLIEPLDNALAKLSPEDWRVLNRDAVFLPVTALAASHFPTSLQMKQLRACGTRVRTFVSMRLASKARYGLALEMPEMDPEQQLPEIEHAIQSLLTECRHHFNMWKQALPKVRQLYLQGAVAVPALYMRDRELPQEVATEISKAPADFPLTLLATADAAILSAAGLQNPKLHEIARRDNWFAALRSNKLMY